MRRAGIAVAPIPRTDCVGPSNIEMMAVLGEKIDALLGHPFRQVSVLARRHSHQGLEFRVQALKQFGEG